jgi:nitrite reductase/ring-hydroxylating ferredoxin subunit
MSNPSSPSAPIALCPSADLAESSRAHVFDLREFGRPVRGFVLRFEGRVAGYLNRCAHVPTEMDWQPGEFFDDSRQYLICSMHGAAYQPSDGLCVAGPCPGARLTALRVEERDGQVYWYPSDRFGPA